MLKKTTLRKRFKPLRFGKLGIGKLELKPGDMLVLQTDLILDNDQCRALRDRANEQFKSFKVNVAILTAGLKLAILRDGRKIKRRR